MDKQKMVELELAITLQIEEFRPLKVQEEGHLHFQDRNIDVTSCDLN